MKKIKVYGSLGLAMLSCFIIGLYSSSTLLCDTPVEFYRWTLTSIFGLFFLVNFLKQFKQ